MANLINIEGTLINLDNVGVVVWEEEAHEHISHNGSRVTGTLIITVGGGTLNFISTERKPTGRAAYEWLEGTCVATFLEEKDNVSFAICPICSSKYESQKGLDYHLARYHPAEGETQS